MISARKTKESHSSRSGSRIRVYRSDSSPVKMTDSRKEDLGRKGGQKLKIIVLGGLEEVGRNMTVLEYGRDILIIDVGLQFPEEDMPGIDYIIPNISY